MSALRILLFIAVVGLIPLGCRKAANTAILAEPAAEISFDEDILKFAAEYKNWGRVDDRLRWAPTLCEAPPPPYPHFSESKDEGTHGKKLYSLFARHHRDYEEIAERKTATMGQVIVKESWIPEESKETVQSLDDHENFLTITTKIENPDGYEKYDNFLPFAIKGDKVYKASKQADLFIMMKLHPKMPGTDEGWVYATVTPDGKKVTAAGRIESCMKCHQEAKHDRLFGLRE